MRNVDDSLSSPRHPRTCGLAQDFVAAGRCCDRASFFGISDLVSRRGNRPHRNLGDYFCFIIGASVRLHLPDGGVGIVSGMCNSAGIGGLPVAAFMSAQPIEAAIFRATMIVYLTGLDMITMPLLWAGGLVTWDTAIGVAMAFPLLGLGVWLGGRQFLSTSPASFRRFAVMLLLALSLLGLLRAFIRI